jgi:hypothetical protein
MRAISSEETMATEVGRKEGSEFWWRNGVELSFLDASNSGGGKCLECLVQRYTYHPRQGRTHSRTQWLTYDLSSLVHMESYNRARPRRAHHRGVATVIESRNEKSRGKEAGQQGTSARNQRNKHRWCTTVVTHLEPFNT